MIGGAGNDHLDGGGGENQYLVEAGVNTISGGTGLDVVFLDQAKEDVDGLDMTHAKDRHRQDMQLEMLPDDLVFIQFAPRLHDQHLVIVLLEYEIQTVGRNGNR